MNEKENIFDIRSNIDPVDNKPYVEVLKEDKDYKARFAAKNKKDFNVQLKKDNVEADLSKRSWRKEGYGWLQKRKF
jgi:hypothetical protein